MFNALVVNKGEDEKTSAAVEKVSIDQFKKHQFLIFFGALWVAGAITYL